MNKDKEKVRMPVRLATVGLEMVLEAGEDAFLTVEQPKDVEGKSDYVVLLAFEAGEWDVHIYLNEEQREKLIEQLRNPEVTQY